MRPESIRDAEKPWADDYSPSAAEIIEFLETGRREAVEITPVSAAFEELRQLVVDRPDLGERSLAFTKVCPDLIRTKIDWGATRRTGNLVLIRYPSENFQAFLATLRAMRKRDGDDQAEVAAAHGPNPPFEKRRQS